MKKIILMAAVGLIMSLTGNAQKQGFVNVGVLMHALPAYDKAEKDLNDYAKTFADALETMSKEYRTKVDAFKKEEKTMTEAMKEAKYQDIMSLEGRMSEYQESSQRKVADKQNTLMEPIIANMNKAITEYALSNNFDYIFSSEGLLFAKDSDNLTPALITKMGGKIKTADAASAAQKGGTPGK
ncbi:MAG TPA: OmpH family outer membrane protein [Edaphocola sp.]|nr:OmpH family outer membrane protein [Edaphocola sp.]